MNEEKDASRLNLVLAAAFLAVVGAGVVDLVLDDPQDWLSLHVLVELAMVSMSLGLALFLWRRWWVTSDSLTRTRRTLAERREERDEWRRSARTLLVGLGRVIDERFDAWELTPTEREVALHLLKGRSHKRIARMTDRSERTVRQHAVSVYRKSGLAGRAELSGFFLEDLMLPRGGEASVEGSGIREAAIEPEETSSGGG